MWGDGFADDVWSHICGVGTWAQCSLDEYIRLFPRLLATAPQPDPFVLEHLAQSMAAQADRGAAGMIETVLSALQTGVVPTIEPRSTADFAFHAGLHPAYVWPGALCTAERDMAAGWLGLLCRERAALMPLDVADYFVDVIADDGSKMTLGDPVIAALVDSRDVGRLRYWALRRRAGHARVLRMRKRSRARWLFASIFTRVLFGPCLRAQ